MKEDRSCSNCMKGISVNVNNDILCRIKGVVSPDYICGKHKYMPERKQPVEVSRKCMDCEFFIEDKEPSGNALIGLCRLFSVRKYDGRQKKACSKYQQRKQQEVS